MEISLINSWQDSVQDLSRIIRPKDVIKEVKKIILLIFPHFDFSSFLSVYYDVVKLFKGQYEGYLKCDTGYHNLRHTQDCILEMARLIHGVSLKRGSFDEKDINLGLISAIMHDTGYIKTIDEPGGTGGKFTIVHIDRSLKFLKGYLTSRGFPARDIAFCENCLKCTGLSVKVKDIRFISPQNELMGKILGTADLIGQMADPYYLKKLPILFKEFQEAGITLYADEVDLLEKTPDFWEFTKKRFKYELGNMDRYLQDHYRVRWGIDRNLDREAVENNIENLKYILRHHRQDYRRFLKGKIRLASALDNSAMCPS
jgi:hypothetical protein